MFCFVILSKNYLKHVGACVSMSSQVHACIFVKVLSQGLVSTTLLFPLNCGVIACWP